MTAATSPHSHYYKSVKHLDHVDVYRVLQLFNVTDPCLSHAIKKLLVAGCRGSKSINQDVQEAIDSCTRFLEMGEEDGTMPRPIAASGPVSNCQYCHYYEGG